MPWRACAAPPTSASSSSSRPARASPPGASTSSSSLARPRRAACIWPSPARMRRCAPWPPPRASWRCRAWPRRRLPWSAATAQLTRSRPRGQGRAAARRRCGRRRPAPTRGSRGLRALPGSFVGRNGRRISVAVVTVLTVAVVGVVASLQTLPTARIVLTPRTAALGPLAITVTALADLEEPDIDAREVPAVTCPYRSPSTARSWPRARRSSRARARGSVVFSAPLERTASTSPP